MNLTKRFLLILLVVGMVYTGFLWKKSLDHPSNWMHNRHGRITIRRGMIDIIIHRPTDDRSRGDTVLHFAKFKYESYSVHGSGVRRKIYVRIPLYGLMLLFGGWPLWLLISGLNRRKRRRNRGLCFDCGYDLTGNESGVCPECGSSIALKK